jgi:hypothetical protein
VSEASAGTAPAITEEPAANAERPPEAAAAPAVNDEAVVQAERIAFLALASELARGRDVLVINGGANALTGIAAHLDSISLEELAGHDSNDHDLVVADLLTADAAAHDGVGRLAAVVRPETGIALVRFPNRPEFAPLVDAFKLSFGRSITLRQHNWVASALLDDAMFANDDPARAVAASVRKMAAAEPGEELYTVAIAAHGAFPDFRPQLALTRSVPLRELTARLAEADARSAARIAELTAENAAGAARVRELEEELAWYDENRLAIRETVESSGWAKSLLSFWSTALSVLERARRAMR